MKNNIKRVLSLAMAAVMCFSALSFSACAKEQITISFNSMGGSDVAPVFVNKNSAIPEPANPTKPNHVFDGWYTDNNYGTLFNFKQTILTTDQTVYAKWKAEVSYVISFELEDTFVPAVAAAQDEEISAPTQPTREGYVFDGWYTTQNYTVKYNFGVMPERDLTLYGRWLLEENTVKVTFVARNDLDETVVLSEQIVAKGETVSAPDDVLPEDTEIIGWYSESNLLSLYNFERPVEFDRTLYTFYFTKNLVIEGDTLVRYTGKNQTIILPHTVTKIADFAFYNNKTIQNVVLNGKVTQIGRSAFYGCGNLSKINLPTSLTTIGEYAFFDCSRLESVSLPSITVIPKGAFSGCASIKTIVLSDTITSIGAHAFAGCKSIPAFPRMNSLTTLGAYAFSGCSSITTFHIGANLVMGDSALSGCSSLARITVDSANQLYSISNSNLMYQGSRMLLYISRGGDTVYSVPSTISSIAPNAFAGNTSIKKLILPSTFQTADLGSFAGMAIEELEFVGFSQLPSQNRYFSYMFGSSTYTANGMNSSFVPSTLKRVTFTGAGSTLPDYAFYGCSSIVDIDGLQNTTVLGDYALYSCKSLVSLGNMPALVEIGDNSIAFSGIEELNINANLNKIGIGNFTGIRVKNINVDPANTSFCVEGKILYSKDKSTLIKAPYNLLDIEISSSAKTILTDAFEYNEASALVIPDTVEEIQFGALKRMYYIEHITVPFVGQRHYQDSSHIASIEDSYFGSIFGASIKSDPNSDFADMNGIVSDSDSWIPTLLNSTSSKGRVTITGNVRAGGVAGNMHMIYRYAFYRISLYAVDVPNSVVTIGAYAFYGNYGMDFATSPLCTNRDYENQTFEKNRNLVNINAYAFGECARMSYLELVGSLKNAASIGEGAFYGNSFEFVVIEEGVTNIPARCFEATLNEDDTYFSNLSVITLPSSVTSIGDKAFFMAGYQKLDPLGFTFAQQNMVTKEWLYTVDSSNLATIGESAFEGANIRGAVIDLTVSIVTVENTFRLPGSITSIGARAFAGCNNMSNVVIGSENRASVLASIGDEAFKDAFRRNTGSLTIYSDAAPNIGTDVFKDIGAKPFSIRVKNSARSDYDGKWSEWSEFLTEIA